MASHKTVLCPAYLWSFAQHSLAAKLQSSSSLMNATKIQELSLFTVFPYFVKVNKKSAQSSIFLPKPPTIIPIANQKFHYSDNIMGMMASQIISLTIVYSTVYSSADQRKHSKLRISGLCAGNLPVNSPHKWPATRKMFPFDAMQWGNSFRGIVYQQISTQPAVAIGDG